MNWLREPDTEPIPGYRLIEPLGTGGFGEVWKCEAPGGLFKAIKFVFGNLNSLDGDAAKAEQEFKAMERVKLIRHPFLCSFERIDNVNGELVIVMELADKSLHDLHEEYQKAGRPGIPREMLLGFMADAAEGLDHLIDKHNLQHLDVKPKNLFLIADRVKVADFGLVKHLERQSSSGIMGGITPVYAAPETFANKISKHSDQYSLAILYVELLSGQRPFAGKNIRQLAMQHMTEAPNLTMLPECDRPVLEKALSKNPDDRYPSCALFVRALGGGNLRSDITNSSTSIETPPPIRSGRPATLPEVDISSTQPIQTRAKKTPPPVTGRTVNRYPDLPIEPKNQTQSMSVSFRPEEGVLRPVILIGVGSFGRRALQQVRCRLLDRIGELSQVPCFRFLYLDSDPEAVNKAAGGPADAALLPEHVFQASLQQVTSYRRRQLDQLLEWLPREKLYAIPRSLQVGSDRSLGRLAFCDHYLRFQTRIRHDLQVATHPEAIRQSADTTGLTVRTKQPSVYVFASATGGTGGMFLDLGHAVRRALERLHIPDATMTAFLFTGATDDPSSPPEELANVFATLTELNHYADQDMKFAAQYGGPEGPGMEAHGLPFTATYLLPMATRSASAFRDCVSHLAGYVSHDLTTPLGTGLEKIRKMPPPLGRTPFRGFGTFGVWYPRGLLLRSAARQVCLHLLRSWIGYPVAGLPGETSQILTVILGDSRLTPDEIQAFITSESSGTDGNPADVVRGWANHLPTHAEAASRRSDPAGWAATVWDQARDWIGNDPTTDADSPFRRGKLSRTLDIGLKTALTAWQNELTELLRPLEELSGPRAAATEAVLNELIAACRAAAATLDNKLVVLADQRQKAKIEIQTALDALQSGEVGTFSLFGNRIARSLKTVADKVKLFSEIRVKEDLATAAFQFYRRLQHWFEDKQRDLSFARERFDQLTDLMQAHVLLPGGTPHAPSHDDESEETMQTTLRGSNTMRVVLPYGEEHLDTSAAEMLALLPPEELARLELVLTRLVIEPRGGLIGSCRGSVDLIRHLAAPMIEQATAFLANRLPTEDVTAVELSAAGNDAGELARRVASYVRAAAPLASGPAGEERTFVVVPESEAGATYAAEVKKAIPGVTAVPVRGAGADLLFCREQGVLRTADLFRLLEPCWEAYHQRAATIETNPHARFDVSGWLPLVE